MTAHLFQCPSCGAPLIPKGSTSILSCSYCSTSVVVPEELRRVSGVAAWPTLVFDRADETHFTFLLNGQIVSEVDEAHFSQGLVGLAIEAYTPGEEITFDFMDIILRGP